MNPEWILNIDADQIFEVKMREEIHHLINQNEIDVWCFRLYDFWDENHYRDDAMWCAHKTYRSFLLRYKKDFNYTWKETPQHCGHFPKNIYELTNRHIHQCVLNIMAGQMKQIALLNIIAI